MERKIEILQRWMGPESRKKMDKNDLCGSINIV